MGDVMLKRSADEADGGEQDDARAKKIRLNDTFEDDVQDQDFDGKDDVSSCSEDDSEDDDVTAPSVATSNTPFSPVRKDYPSNRKTIRCPFEGCDKAFNRPIRLAGHIRSHNGERPFKCIVEGCAKAYVESKHLALHIKSAHTLERDYPCNWPGCDKGFTTRTRLRRHLEVHEGHERFRCTAYAPCNKTFRKRNTLQQHIMLEHQNLPPFSCPHTDPVTNEPCQTAFRTSFELKKHQDRIHAGPRFFCSQCRISGLTSDSASGSLGFRTKAEYNKHMKTNHLDCAFCELTFTTLAKLERHIEVAHGTGSKPATSASQQRVPCTEPGCGKTFTKKSNLTAHIKSIHQGIKFTCGAFDLSQSLLTHGWDAIDGCGHSFATKANLEDHVRTQHMGLPTIVNANRVKILPSKKQKRIKNDPQDDVESDLLALLTGAAYEQDGERDLPCPINGCAWRFMRDYDLQQHLITRHDEKTTHDNVTTSSELAMLPPAQLHGHGISFQQIEGLQATPQSRSDNLNAGLIHDEGRPESRYWPMPQDSWPEAGEAVVVVDSAPFCMDPQLMCL